MKVRTVYASYIGGIYRPAGVWDLPEDQIPSSAKEVPQSSEEGTDVDDETVDEPSSLSEMDKDNMPATKARKK